MKLKLEPRKKRFLYAIRSEIRRKDIPFIDSIEIGNKFTDCPGFRAIKSQRLDALPLPCPFDGRDEYQISFVYGCFDHCAIFKGKNGCSVMMHKEDFVQLDETLTEILGNHE